MCFSLCDLTRDLLSPVRLKIKQKCPKSEGDARSSFAIQFCLGTLAM